MAKEQQSADEHRRAQKESQDFADQARQRVTESQDRQTSRENAFVQAAVGFLNTELETGLTLARIASRGSDADRRARRCREARKAYDSVVHNWAKAAHASSDGLEAAKQKLATLRQLLESLGEKF